MASFYISVAICLPEILILELDLWESNIVFISYASHCLFCFSMQDSCTDWVLFKELYYWGQDLFSLFSQLDSLSGTMGQDKCEQFCTQMNPDSSATLFKFTSFPSLPQKRKKSWPVLKNWGGISAFTQPLFLCKFSPKVSLAPNDNCLLWAHPDPSLGRVGSIAASAFLWQRWLVIPQTPSHKGN